MTAVPSLTHCLCYTQVYFTINMAVEKMVDHILSTEIKDLALIHVV